VCLAAIARNGERIGSTTEASKMGAEETATGTLRP
jgi:hypothetical protein